MQLSTPLRRLLRIRELEEEQGRLALEAALQEMNRVRAVLETAAQRAKEGRRTLADGLRTDNLVDRIAGLEETHMASQIVDSLQVRIAAAEHRAAELRARFLATRAHRQQAETLVDERDERARLDGERRSQRDLDDWHRSR